MNWIVSFIQCKNSTQTLPVSDNQIARLDEDNVKIEQSVEETISQSELKIQNTDVGTAHQDEAFAAISSAAHQYLELLEPSRTSTGNRKQPDRFGETMPTNMLKKERGCDGFKETSRSLEVFSIKISKNKRATYLTNFVTK